MRSEGGRALLLPLAGKSQEGCMLDGGGREIVARTLLVSVVPNAPDVMALNVPNGTVTDAVAALVLTNLNAGTAAGGGAAA